MGIVFFLATTVSVIAQDDLNIHGVVSDAMSSSKLGGVTVTVKKDGSSHDNYITRANGKYEFYLDCGFSYEFIFEKDGYVDRSIVINSKGVPEEIIGAGIIMPTDMSMYEITPAMDGADLSVFNKPIGKASYDPSQADLVWDFAYTNQVKGEIFKFIRDVDKKTKELEKEASEEEKAALELEKKFADFVKKGDAAMSSVNYEDAVLNYQAAIDLKPSDGAVQAKLGDAQTKWDQQKAQMQLEAEYSAALDAGDGFMRTEEYDKAVLKYEEALKLRPEESYPKDQIEEAQRIIEEIAANKAKQEQFNEIMSEADAFVSEEKYPEGIAKYEEALTVLPGNSEAKSKLKKAQEAFANLEEKAARQAEYEELIASADQAFSTENYEGAKSFYEQASDVFPDETYPKDQISVCETRLNALADAAEKKAEFDELVNEGNQAISSADYQKAVDKFTEALTVLPNTEPAVAKLAEAKTLLDEQLADQQKQENYDALISEADNALDNEDYELAKTKYTEAKQVIPEEIYPTDQISKIDGILAQLAGEKAIQEAYDKAMAAGATAMEGEKFQDAVGHFTDALSAIPDDKDATRELEKANEALAELQANQAQQEQYDGLIAAADEKFGAADWAGAISSYEAALEIFSSEPYPKEKIDEANANIEKEKSEAEAAELQAQFDALVAEGDNALTAKDFDTSIDKYKEALKLLDSSEVETKLANAEAAKEAFLEKQGLQERYDDALAKADESFQGQDWTKSIELYLKAQEIKPDETYPSDQIKLANEAIASAEAAAQAELQSQFDGLVAEGDKFVEDKSFDLAVSNFEEAIDLIESAEVEQKIENAKRLKEEYLKQQGIAEQYADAISTADGLFQEKAWIEAKASYEAAAEIKPDEQYPKDQIALIEETIASEEAAKQAELQAEFDGLVAQGDKAVEDKNFTEGIEKYEGALDLMESSEVEGKIAAAREARDQFEDARDKQERYDQAIAEADVDFSQSSWSAARSGYENASSILPDESYPKDQIKLIDDKIAAEDAAAAAAAQAEREARVKALVAEGDQGMTAADFNLAIGKFEEALAIIPDREDVTKKLEEAETALLAQQESEALEQAYQNAINSGNSDFERENWESALSSFEEALKIKPSESYPEQKIDEINQKLDAIAEAERLEREAELKKDFDKLIADGDKQFNKTKFDKALVEYETALALIPESSLAQQKVEAAKEALGELEADRAAMENYKAAIDEADGLFKEKSYEMAKLKYTDASEIMPNEEYPRNKMIEIDLLLEKQRLQELADEKDKLEREYQAAINEGDGAFASNDFDQARSAYENALKIKPDETYPLGQLERIDLKIEEAANAERERERLAALEEERRLAEEKRRESLSRVNSNSEDQAERFMREAREAEDQERYERVKKEKVSVEENLVDYEEQSQETRMANYMSFDSYRRKFRDQYREPISMQKSKIGNSIKYKKAVLDNFSKPEELDKVKNAEQYEQLANLQLEIERWKREMEDKESESIRKESDNNEQLLIDIEETAAMNYSERVTANKVYQQETKQRYKESEQLAAKRRENAKQIQEQNEQYGEFLADLDEKSIARAKENKIELTEKYSGRANSSDTFRSELADNYPQGVTEESSTLGNKVIITRIVVSGKHGDEYKKVVDKAGEYYFKNGGSISENTWSRETIEAFNKSKD
ncbi:MAG: hypothetical protein AAGC47_04130 [Bacteroidota bacterium]